MNANYLTSLKDCDYRFVSRLLTSVYNKEELIKGCVKVDGLQPTKPPKYNELDPLKFDFIKGICFGFELFKLN